MYTDALRGAVPRGVNNYNSDATAVSIENARSELLMYNKYKLGSNTVEKRRYKYVKIIVCIIGHIQVDKALKKKKKWFTGGYSVSSPPRIPGPSRNFFPFFFWNLTELSQAEKSSYICFVVQYQV